MSTDVRVDVTALKIVFGLSDGMSGNVNNDSILTNRTRGQYDGSPEGHRRPGRDPDLEGVVSEVFTGPIDPQMTDRETNKSSSGDKGRLKYVPNLSSVLTLDLNPKRTEVLSSVRFHNLLIDTSFNGWPIPEDQSVGLEIEARNDHK